MRFVHTADWQLGMTRHFLNGEAQPRYSAARRDAVAGLGALAAEAGAEFVVVAGDVFEHNQLAPRVVSQSLEAMRAIGVPVYLLPGNHDPLDASSVYTSALFTAECPDNVIGARPGRRARGAAGAADRRRRHGVPRRPPPTWSPRCSTTCPPTASPGSWSATAVSTSSTRTGQAVADPAGRRSKPRIARGAVHYVALGDKHSRTAGRHVPAGSGTPARRRSPTTTTSKPDPGHVLVVDVDEDDPRRPVRVDPRRVGRWRFVTLRRSVDSSRDIADLDINLDLMPDKERTVVRLALTGSLTVTDKAALDACLDKYARLFAALGLWERQTDIAVIPADGEFDDLGIGGFRRRRCRGTGGRGTLRRRGRRRRQGGAGAAAASRRQGHAA